MMRIDLISVRLGISDSAILTDARGKTRGGGPVASDSVG
jgi:hypothetical protein